MAVSADKGTCVAPVRYAFRSFDRQWIIPDARLLNQPNPTLWGLCSDLQLFMTAVTRKTIKNGPALTITDAIPDLDHYSGRGGRVFPLWGNAAGTHSNFSPKLVDALSQRYGKSVTAEDVFAYVAGIAANPAYTARFLSELATPGLRIPITANADTFAAIAAVGRRVVWLHSYGERMADAAEGRPPGPPRVSGESRPTMPKQGAMPPADMLPEAICYDEAEQRLHFGKGFIDNVIPAVWKYEVDGKQVVSQWFSYRRRDRSKPVMGDKRPPSPLQGIQPDHWPAEYTTDLLNLLNVLTLLVDMEPEQTSLLAQVCEGAIISEVDLKAAGAIGAFEENAGQASLLMDEKQAALF